MDVWAIIVNDIVNDNDSVIVNDVVNNVLSMCSDMLSRAIPFGPAGCVSPWSRDSMDICQIDLVVRLPNSSPTTLCLGSAEPGKHFSLILILD